MAPHSSTLAWKIPWTEEPGLNYCTYANVTLNGVVSKLSLQDSTFSRINLPFFINSASWFVEHSPAFPPSPFTYQSFIQSWRFCP